VLSLVFYSVGVAVFVVYHLVFVYRPGTRNNLLFLNAKPNLNSTKNCLCTSDGFRCGKVVGFWQHSNTDSVRPLGDRSFRRLPHEHGTLYHNRFRMRLLFLSSVDGTWRLCCSSCPFRLTNNMSRAVYQRQTVTCLATLTESDCTVVLQQKCDNATLIIFISTTTTTSVLLR